MNAFMITFFWFTLIKLDILAKAWSFCPAFLHNFVMCVLKLSLSKLTPRIFSQELLDMRSLLISIQAMKVRMHRQVRMHNSTFWHRSW